MTESKAIGSLALLVAVCEQVMLELEHVEPALEGAVERIVRSRDDATQLARELVARAAEAPQPSGR